jgi:hypothetical protein
MQSDAFEAQQIEGHEGGRRLGGQPRDARGGRMHALLQRVEVEPRRRGDHDLAIERAARRQPFGEHRVQVRKVAVQRLGIAALDAHAERVVEHDGPEAVPLRLEQEVAGLGQAIGHLGQHRQDRRGLCHRARRCVVRRARGRRRPEDDDSLFPTQAKFPIHHHPPS